MKKVIEIRCDYCHKVHTIICKEEDYQKWIGGDLIQCAFPYLSADDRELMISKICGKCFDAVFSNGEE